MSTARLADESRRHQRQWQSLGLALVVALVITVVIAVEASRPAPRVRLLFGVGGLEGGRVPVGRTAFIDSEIELRHHMDSPLRLMSVRPVVGQNTADATFRVLECRALPVGLIGADTDIDSVCSRAHPFRPGPVDLRYRGDDIVLAVSARQRGRLVVHGFRVVYRSAEGDVVQRVGIVMKEVVR